MLIEWDMDGFRQVIVGPVVAEVARGAKTAMEEQVAGEFPLRLATGDGGAEITADAPEAARAEYGTDAVPGTPWAFPVIAGMGSLEQSPGNV